MAAHVLAPPENGDALTTVAAAQGVEGGHKEADAAIVTAEAAARKRLATAQARAALRGAVLHELRDDAGGPEYVLTFGAFTRGLPSLDEVDALLSRMEGGQ